MKNNIHFSVYPLNVIKDCLQIGIEVKKESFSTKGLRGIAIKGSGKEKDIIVLNPIRNPEEQNFDCGHECVHLFKHRNEKVTSFHCFETVLPQQNSFLEWQANEGSAELLVPYKFFIPMFCKYRGYCKNATDYMAFKNKLAEIFKVPVAVITLRIENLKYEIYQYENGISLDNIEIKSNTQLKRERINIVSYNAIYDFVGI
jgi:Zn-dependent peptidase ImmA (M78 family)